MPPAGQDAAAAPAAPADAPAAAAPLAAAAPAAPTGAELDALRRDVVRVINEQVGPLAGSLVARLERTRSADELRPLLDSASRVVGLMRGDEAAADFRARFMNW
jgi:hypothetical protein